MDFRIGNVRFIKIRSVEKSPYKNLHNAHVYEFEGLIISKVKFCDESLRNHHRLMQKLDFVKKRQIECEK